MLHVTESALDHLDDILASERAQVLRLTTTHEGLALKPDDTRSGDMVFERRGQPVLVLDEVLAGVISEQTLDLARDGGNAKLTLR